mmetsp:Transcript_41587/g.123459  ORF Transcript_41587/g.123459 Transcript_41587/m.123459 type:complete len:505 (-) Transcript_41587:84-1598(-)
MGQAARADAMSGLSERIVKTVLFPCPHPSYTIDSFPGELIWIPQVPSLTVAEGGPMEGTYPRVGDPDAPSEERGEPVPCLMLPYESARFCVIFFHSNAEDLGRCRWFCHFLREQFQVHVLAVEYPGYGICGGPPSREGVIANAHAALQFALNVLKLPLEQIKLFGRSIGTGPALTLASRFNVAGVILVTPFANVKRLFQERVGPLAAFVEEWFDNSEAIKEVQSPTMFIHGRKDAIIPFQHSEALYKDCYARKVFVNPAGMEHNTNLTTDVSCLIVPMFRFFSLPDYSFEELQVPAWVYDKRRSPLYVRPAMEVFSRSSVGRSSPEEGPVMAMPGGDDEEIQPLDKELLHQGEWDFQEGSPLADSLSALTHPTVRHSYHAKKQCYDFGSPVIRKPDDSFAAEGNREQLPAAAAVGRRSLGDRLSASSPGPKGQKVSSVYPTLRGDVDEPDIVGLVAKPIPREEPLHADQPDECAAGVSPSALLRQASPHGKADTALLHIHSCPI